MINEKFIDIRNQKSILESLLSKLKLPVESPTLILNTPLAVHCAVTLPRPENPVTVDVMLELGLKGV